MLQSSLSYCCCSPVECGNLFWTWVSNFCTFIIHVCLSTVAIMPMLFSFPQILNLVRWWIWEVLWHQKFMLQICRYDTDYHELEGDISSCLFKILRSIHNFVINQKKSRSFFLVPLYFKSWLKCVFLISQKKTCYAIIDNEFQSSQPKKIK